MKTSFVFSLALAAALGMAQASYAAVISDSVGPASPAQPGAPIVVGFTEFIDNTLTHTTDEVHSGDRGIVPGTIFVVDKFVHNDATARRPWEDFHIQLQALIDGVWVNSGQGDGISFGDIENNATFLANATVDINGNLIDRLDPITGNPNWTLSRDVLHDLLTYNFLDFVVNPGDTLSLHFDMSDNDKNIWRLVQRATVPEPGSLALLGSGPVAFGVFRRRRRSKQS